MGCGCGKKSAPRLTTAAQTVGSTNGASRVQAAQTFQSGTMKGAPQAPITRKTV